jgi:hypothetical protein
MPILKRVHGLARAVATSIRSSIGRFGSNQPGERPLNSATPQAFVACAQEAFTMSKLFFVNIPYNCSDRELQEWVESRGIKTRSIRIVRDLVAGVSPAFGYVELKDDGQIPEAITVLNGKRMRNQTILVKEAQTQGVGVSRTMERRSA